MSITPLSRRHHRTLDEVWAAYDEGRDLFHRNALIVAYQSLVTTAVRRLPSHVRSYWGEDELRSFGQDGLVKAIERWEGDASRFEAYALKRIRGAIFDEFRRLDWVPRSTRERINAYRVTKDRLSHELGRDPSHGEVVAAMGLDDKRGHDLLVELRASQQLHLSTLIDGDSPNESFTMPNRSSEAQPEAQVIDDVLPEELAKATARLLPREQAIIHLAFVAGLSQEQIGDIIGVSGSQVCKIQGRALTKLRTVLEPVYYEQDLAVTA